MYMNYDEYYSQDELCEKCIIKQLLNSVFA